MKRLSFSLKMFITLFVLCIAGIVVSTIAIDKQIDSYIEEMKTEIKIEVVNNSDNEVDIKQEGNKIMININPKDEQTKDVTDNKELDEYVIVTSNSGLNIREEPSLDSEKVGTFYYGAKIRILEDCGDWYRTESGFIFKEYVIKI